MCARRDLHPSHSMSSNSAHFVVSLREHNWGVLCTPAMMINREAIVRLGERKRLDRIALMSLLKDLRDELTEGKTALTDEEQALFAEILGGKHGTVEDQAA
jgi:hypothetical protein